MRKGRFAAIGESGGDAAGPGASPLRTAFTLPTIAAAGMTAAVAASAMFADPTTTLASAFLGGALVAGSLAAARRRLLNAVLSPDSHEALRSRGFVALSEAAGRNWFWETNADGALTYLSPPLADALGANGQELTGRQFTDLLPVEQPGGEAGEGPTLAFHLGARFPFTDILVASDKSAEKCWLLSGSPRFDEVGRFLGFHGFGTACSMEKKEQAQAARLAQFDSLTGLPNRARIEAMLDEALTNSDNRKQSCAIFLIDLDRFKQVNDTLGHPVGDVLLQQASERLTAVLGEDGQVGRLGGDEFTAVFPGIGEEGRLAAIADSLIGAVSAPYLIHGHQVSIGASVGVAISRPGKTYRQGLVKEADLALYAAKRAGRGTFRFFEPEMHAEETDRKILENDLKSAVAKGQLKLLYQPIVAVSSETLVGFEALVRWWHPTRGPLSPADFLPIAEASGQMAALGEWIIRTACAEAARWPRHLRLAINLAPGQLGAGITAVLTGALASSGLDPERLDLEVREEVLLDQDSSHRDSLLALHGLGIRLSLDDFGSGATSLASLKAVPLDRIKLHPSFLRAALPRNSRPRTLATALMRLAEALGMSVTAEGAETLEDLELIRLLGCDDVQGYLFGRPMEPHEALAMAADSKPLDAKEAARNRPPRHSLIRNGTLFAGKESWPVRMRNISAGGAMIESGRPLPPGGAAELDLGDNLRLAATVRWAHDGRLGLQFAEAFDLSRLGKTRRELPEVRMLIPDFLQEEPRGPTPITIKKIRKS
jgi:diguanylate cyclase (GGDEF)-like protein